MKKMTILAVSSLVLLVSVAIAAIYDDGHDGGHNEDMAAIITQGRSSISLQQVIDTVAADAKGPVTEVDLERLDKPFSFSDGPLVYQVEAMTPNGAMEYLVDPTDGKIMSKSKDRWNFFDDETNVSDLQLTLEQAVTKAEQTTHEKAISAELESEEGLAVYRIKMISEGSSRNLFVNPMNGKVLLSIQGESDDE